MTDTIEQHQANRLEADQPEASEIEAQIGAYAERLLMTGLSGMEAITIALGRELGLYAALGRSATASAAELAEVAAIAPRYAREWLEQQAAAGWIEVAGFNGPGGFADSDTRRYALSPAAQECLLRPESLASVGPLFDFLPSLALVYPTLREAFRTGVGVPYADYGVHDAQGDFNRPAFVNLLATQWLPAIPGLVERLARPGARVAEIGCGEGWAAVSVARAFPGVHVDGFDLDEASVAAARKHAATAGVADRVRFEVADVTNASSLPGGGTYDLVCAFEMIHDLARPVDALSTMRRLAKPDATVLVVDEKAGEVFEAATSNPVERLFYAASVLHCLPVGLAGDDSAGTGAVMRPPVFREYATEAGFTSVDMLPIDYDLFHFYRLNLA